MTLLHVPYIHYRNFDYFEEQTNGTRDIIFVVGITIMLSLILLSIGSWIGSILKRQTNQYMKFTYQLYCGSVANQTPSLIEQTTEEAVEKAKELSKLLDCILIVRYPNGQRLCSTEKGELKSLFIRKVLQVFSNSSGRWYYYKDRGAKRMDLLFTLQANEAAWLSEEELQYLIEEQGWNLYDLRTIDPTMQPLVDLS